MKPVIPGLILKIWNFFERIKNIELVNSKIAAFGSTRRCNVKVEEDKNIQSLVASEASVAVILGRAGISMLLILFIQLWKKIYV